MAIKLTLREKNYLVALYGDISWEARERLFSFSSFPAQCGPYVMQHGYRFHRPPQRWPATGS
jgi:hypothetical protein